MICEEIEIPKEITGVADESVQRITFAARKE